MVHDRASVIQRTASKTKKIGKTENNKIVLLLHDRATRYVSKFVLCFTKCGC